MHLLYDTHGVDGTPIILPQNKRKGLEERVAWVHTLCALFIGQSQKVVFGCKKDGTYLGEKEDDDDDDDCSEENDGPKDSSLFDSDGKPLITLNNPHHFVLAGADGKLNCEWSKAVRKIKKERFKCTICGVANDLKSHKLAIPVSDMILLLQCIGKI